MACIFLLFLCLRGQRCLVMKQTAYREESESCAFLVERKGLVPYCLLSHRELSASNDLTV